MKPENPQEIKPPRDKRHKIRVALVTALVILLGGSIFFALKYRADAIKTFLWPPKDEQLKLSFDLDGRHAPFDSVETLHHPIVKITGHTNLPCEIELFVDGKLIGRTATFFKETFSKFGRTVEPNWFEFEQVRLEPGEHSLLFRAQLIRDGRAPDPDVEVRQTIAWVPQENSDPVLYRLPGKITTQPLRVQGSAFPGSSVVLSVFGREKPDSTFKKVVDDVVLTANDKGHFEGDLSFPRPGDYQIAPHRSADDPLKTYFRSETAIRFAPSSSNQVVFSVSYDQISIDIQATRPKDDQAAADLLSGQNSLAQFLDREFDLRVNERTTAFEFRDVVPQISIDESHITVRAQAALSRSSIFPVRRGSLEISRGYRHDYPLQSSADSLKIIVKDYTTEGYIPVPNLVEYPTAVWTGVRDPFDWSQGVRVSLDFNPTKNPRDLFRLLTLSPYELFDYKFASLFYLLTCLLYAIPFLWLFYLLEKYPSLPWIDPAYIKRLRRVSNLLLGLILLPGVQRLADGVADEIFVRGALQTFADPELPRFLRLNSSDHPLLLAAGTLAILLVLVTLLTVVRALTSHTGLRVWLMNIRRGFRNACLINLLLLLFYWAVLILTEDSGESFIPTVMVTLPVLALLALSVYLLAKPGRPAIRFRYLFLLVILLFLMAYPTARSIYALGRSQFSTWDVTRTSLNNFFGMIQDFLPYILLVGILQILRSATRREDERHPFVYDIPLLLFSCYVIGTTVTWFLVPIPFFLALIMYPRLLALPATKVNALTYLKPRAVKKRRWFLDRVLELSLTERLLSAVDQMEKKIASGDLPIKDFLKRREELERYAAGVRQENLFIHKWEAKDLALSLGPHSTNWLNGVHALKRGLVISLPFLLLYLLTFLIKQINLNSSFVFLWTTLRIITFVLDWAVYAFVFGYFFNQLKGESGLKKGLRVALVVIACLIPVWLTSGASAVELSATFLRAGQIFLFFTVLGVWAFDYYTFRNTLKEHFSWKRFVQFGDMPRFAAVASVLLTSAGVALTSVLKGRFVEVITQLVSAIFPDTPRPGP